MMGRILALDYGMRRCGLAVTDPLQLIAQPLDTIDKSELKSFLMDYIKDENVEALVVGMPYNMDGSVSEMIKHIEVFKAWFISKFPEHPIYEVDERLTSIEAKKIIQKSVKSKKKRRDKGLVDRISASIILESYLNSKKTRNLNI